MLLERHTFAILAFQWISAALSLGLCGVALKKNSAGSNVSRVYGDGLLASGLHPAQVEAMVKARKAIDALGDQYVCEACFKSGAFTSSRCLPRLPF